MLKCSFDCVKRRIVMKIGIYQFKPIFGKKEFNLMKVKDAIKSPCDIVALPELFSTGYSFKDIDELNKFAEPIPQGDTTHFLSEIAKDKNCFIVGGIAEKENNRLYNTAVIIGPQGYIGKYRKIHLFYKEKFLFQKGDLPLTTFNIEGVKVGVIICFDWIYPETCRTLALQGAHIIIHPSNLIKPWAQMAMRIRSIENRVYTVLANRIGIENRAGETLKFTGMSQIASPTGEILLSLPKNKELFSIVDIDPNLAEDKFFTSYNNLFEDL